MVINERGFKSGRKVEMPPYLIINKETVSERKGTNNAAENDIGKVVIDERKSSMDKKNRQQGPLMRMVITIQFLEKIIKS